MLSFVSAVFVVEDEPYTVAEVETLSQALTTHFSDVEIVIVANAVADDVAFARFPDGTGEHFSRVDAHAERQLDALRRRTSPDLGIDLAHRTLHGEPRSNGPLRIILMGDGRPEDRHDVVTDELVDVSSAIGHLAAQALERPFHEGLGDLGVELLGDRGIAGEIGEQNGCQPPLLGQLPLDLRRWLRLVGSPGEGRPALTAEARARYSGRPTVGAGDRLISAAADAESRRSRIVGSTLDALQRAHPVSLADGMPSGYARSPTRTGRSRPTPRGRYESPAASKAPE